MARPAGAAPAGTAAPLRGRALGEVDVLEDAYVLCAGESIEAYYAVNDFVRKNGTPLGTEPSGFMFGTT